MTRSHARSPSRNTAADEAEHREVNKRGFNVRPLINSPASSCLHRRRANITRAMTATPSQSLRERSPTPGCRRRKRALPQHLGDTHPAHLRTTSEVFDETGRSADTVTSLPGSPLEWPLPGAVLNSSWHQSLLFHRPHGEVPLQDHSRSPESQLLEKVPDMGWWADGGNCRSTAGVKSARAGQVRGDALLSQKRYTNAEDDAAPISSCAEIPNVYIEAVHGG